ncbi:MAG: RNA polymerase factor sigma-54 [Candidatus Omnitrophica bacterium]|nr:RNA polymerase factor sigma-54 [Candidatus Omnitrophota bacterium]
MEPRLIQQQSQKLVLSPQIRQYLKLLQLPLAQLQQEIDIELSANPLLDEKPSSEAPDDNAASQNKPEEGMDRPTEELQLGETYNGYRNVDENYHEDFGDYDISRQDPKELQKQKSFQESLITKPEGLYDFLLWQIRFLELGEMQKKIAHEIIGNINEAGYLKATTEEIAQACSCEPKEIENVLAIIQDLDPPGIAARNLQEALLIQLKKKGSETKLAVQIVSEHFTLLEKRDLKQMAKILTVDLGVIKKAVDMIAHCEPRPGRTFYLEEPIAVTPDATVSHSENPKEPYKIDIHVEYLPELRINPYYRRLLRDKKTDAKTKAYLRDKMLSATNFMRALGLRKSTIREITEALVEVQADFFSKGFSHLKPLRLKDIADKIGMHESTVSRALQGKYISTPQGVIPYKSFFSSKLETRDGETESQKSIMEKIKRLIEKENPKDPLSDQDILKRLTAEGIMIARRTVAKYRELLKILPSHMRRAR